MTRQRTPRTGRGGIDWAAVEADYGERACLRALDAVMADARAAGQLADWDATKADALALLRRDHTPGSSVRAGLRDIEH